MDNVIPIRPADPDPAGDKMPINVINRNLAHAHAIADLIQALALKEDEHEEGDALGLDKGTLGNALWALKDMIDTARQAADKLSAGGAQG